jgi:transmembrane sensor
LLNNKTKRVERKQVDVDTYSAWRSNRLVFVGTRLDEIAQVLEDNYGYEVEFESEAAKENEFTGSASVDNLDELLGKMERVFNLKMSRDGKKLIIKNK